MRGRVTGEITRDAYFGPLFRQPEPPNPLGLPPEVLCLALHQPYADLVVGGVKTLETRKWAWPYPPSWLAVYATKTPDMPAVNRLQGEISRALIPGHFIPNRGDLALGAIVGVVWVAGCRPMRPEDEKAACFPFETGRYVWLLERPQRLAVPDRTLALGPRKFQRLSRALLLAALAKRAA